MKVYVNIKDEQLEGPFFLDADVGREWGLANDADGLVSFNLEDMIDYAILQGNTHFEPLRRLMGMIKYFRNN